MGDKGEAKKLLMKKTSSVPRILYSFNQEEENSEETDQLDENASGFSSERVITANRLDTYPFHLRDNVDAGQDTTNFVPSPIPTPEVSRRDSLNFSILDENFITNVQPIPYLTPSPIISSDATEVNPLLSFGDLNHMHFLNDSPTNEKFTYLLEKEASLAAEAIAFNLDADTEDDSDVVSQHDRCNFSSPTTSPLDNLIIAESLTPKHLYSARDIRNEPLTINSACVDELDYEECRVLSVNQGRLLGESTNGRSQSSADLSSSKFSRQTRCTSDIAKTSSSNPTKNAVRHALADFRKVESQTRLYTKKKTPQSSKPSITKPTTQPAGSLAIPPSRQSTLIRAVHPKSNSADNLLAHPDRNFIHFTKQSAKVSTGTQTTPRTDQERRRISLLSNSSYDPVTELVQDLRNRIDLAEKEKLAFRKAYEISEQEAQRLEAYIANGHKIIDGTLSPNCSLGFRDLIGDAIKPPDRRLSSLMNVSGWITSSSSDDLSHPSQKCEEVVEEVQSTAPTQSTSDASMPQKEINSSTNYSQGANQPGEISTSSQHFVVMGVRQKIALAKSVNECRKKSFQTQDHATLAVCYSPTSFVDGDRNVEDKAEAVGAIDSPEDLIQTVSQVPSQTEEDDEYLHHVSKIMWKAGFYLNKTATALIPEVQGRLNLGSPREFCTLRKLASKKYMGIRSSIGKSTMRSPVSSPASSQTSLSFKLRGKFRLPSITPKNRRRSKSVERF